MKDEAEQWFYNLGKLAALVESNQALSKAAQAKADTTRKRTLALTCFVLFAFLLLAWRSEVNSGRINDSNRAITVTQRATCESGLAIITKFNAQQDILADIERTNQFIDDPLREARIKAYEDVRVIPLPICATR